MAQAYSAQIYTLAHQRNWRLFCFPNNPCQPLRRGQISVLPFPKPTKQGLHFFVEEIRYGYKLARLSKRLHVDLIICATGMHPLGYLAASMFSGKPIVISLHNTLWIRGQEAPKGLRGIILRNSARFLRKRIARVVAVSDEIRNQVLQLWKLPPDRVAVHVPQYELASMPSSSPSNDLPRRILFAGRVQTHKGIDDILHAAKILEDDQPNTYHWVFAGEGPALANHQATAQDLGLDHATTFLGQVDRATLIQEITKCFVTITPTRATFNEGLAKLPLEGAILGRPAIVSTVVPALDLLEDAAIGVRPSDPKDIAHAVQTLHENTDLYLAKCNACNRVRDLVTDETISFRTRIAQAVDAAINNQ